SVLRFLVWVIWCCAARWSLFHKSYRRSCYASGLYSKAEEELFGICKPAARTPRKANSCRNLQRLKLSWSSSSRMRTSHRNTHFTQSRVLRRDQISVSIMPILAM
ncbi:hypothetical protein P692DRAFT_20917526, partial [Suillus brevipes Sb2]